MKRILPILLLLPLAAAAIEVDGIAARVGSAVILKSEVADELRRLGYDESRYVEVRNTLIERTLILKAASESKMTIQDWVIENRIREIIDRAFGGDRNKLMETLAKQRISYPEWHDRIRDDMVVAAMRWQVVDKNVTASPAAMKAEYEAHPERYAAEYRVSVSVILLSPDDIDKRADVDGELKVSDFATVAKKHSSDVHAVDGGLWKDVKPEEVFRPEICEELSKMPRGTISKWIELDGWSFLLRKDEESDNAVLPFADAYDRIAENIHEEAAKKLYDDWIGLLKAETYIKVY